MLENMMSKALVKHFNDTLGWIISNSFIRVKINDYGKFVQRLGDGLDYVDHDTIRVTRRGKIRDMKYDQFFRLLIRLSNKRVIGEDLHTTLRIESVIEYMTYEHIKEYEIIKDFDDIVDKYNDSSIDSCLTNSSKEELEVINRLGVEMLWVNTSLIKMRCLLIKDGDEYYASNIYHNSRYSLHDSVLWNLGFKNLIDYTGEIVIEAPKLICYVDLFESYYDKEKGTIRFVMDSEIKDEELDMTYLTESDSIVLLEDTELITRECVSG